MFKWPRPILPFRLVVYTPFVLRYAKQSTVPKSKLRSRGDKSFSIATPKIWNSLPIHIRTAPTLLFLMKI